MIDDSDWGIWSLTRTYTAGLGGASALAHDIAAGAGNVIHITQLHVLCTAAGTATLDIDLIDEDRVSIVKYVDLAAAAANDGTIPRLNDDVLTTTDSPLASSHGGVWLAGPDVMLLIVPGNLAQNDTVLIALIAKVMRGPGTEAATFAGAYVDATTVNEVY